MFLPYLEKRKVKNEEGCLKDGGFDVDGKERRKYKGLRAAEI